MRNFSILLAIAALVALSAADVYLHSPRGQNDRCDEKSNNRNNENRGWNSNNNAAGGYSYCDKEMHFYEGTTIRVEWYSQHGCGNGAQTKSDPTNPDTLYCRHLLQLGCDFTFATQTNDPAFYFTDGMSLGRPGADQYNVIGPDDNNGNDTYNTFGSTCTDTRPLTLQYQVKGQTPTTTSECGNSATNDAQCNTDLADGTGTFNSDTCNCHPRKMKTYMLHEPETWYWKCKSRQRNQGLFTATQNPNSNNGAQNTRQEPNSARYGYECTEERDYWPYWHPTPWIDLAVFTSDTTLCPMFQQYSQNVLDKCECVAAATINTYPPTTDEFTAQMYNNRIACESANYKWNCTGNWNWPAPACLLAPSQVDNRLASIDNMGDNTNTGKSKGEALAFYDWVVPNLNSALFPKRSDPNSGVRCLIRLRYNITAGEVMENYDALNNPTAIKGNPVVTFGAGNYTLPANVTMPLRHAVNTAQYGRTFEDRTYIFNLVPRSAASTLDGVTDSSFATSAVYNLNVRGKRGNIAQVRNCYEYDFVPRILYASVGDFIHFQYCLSDYNDNGNAGEGRAGTDRINMVPIGNANKNVLVPSNKTAADAPLLDSTIGGQIFNLADWASIAFLNQDPQYCASSASMATNNNNGQTTTSCHFLNGLRDAANGALPTSYFSHVAKVVSQGNLQYISSRNNNFTNRSQKGTIIVGGVGSAGMIAGATVGAVAGAALIGGGAFLLVKKGVFTASRV